MIRVVHELKGKNFIKCKSEVITILFYSFIHSFVSSTDPRPDSQEDILNVLKLHHHPKVLLISQLNNLSCHQGRIPRNIARNLQRPTRSKHGMEIFGEFAKEVYHAGTNNPNHSGGDVQEGGGPQTLTSTTISQFCFRFKTMLTHSNLNEDIKILWVGIGMAEEAILFTRYFKAQQPPIMIKIHGIDISRDCVIKAKKLIQKFGCDDLIQVKEKNIFDYIPKCKYTCTYTSAAVNEIFSLKLLHTSVKCQSQWCFLSSPSSGDYTRFKFPKTGLEKSWVKGTLTGSGEARNISKITLPFLNIDALKGELNEYSRELLVNELRRNFTSCFDKIYTLYLRSKNENETKLTLSFNDLIGHHYANDYVNWRDFVIDLNEEVSIASNLEARVVTYPLKQRIIHHFLEQYILQEVPQRLFPEYEYEDDESVSVSDESVSATEAQVV